MSPSLWRANLPFLWLSLQSAALMNILPQRVLQHWPDNSRNLWLAGILLSGALAALLGVHLAARQSRPSLRGGWLAVLGLGGGLVWAVLGQLTPVEYGVLHGLLCLCANYLTQFFDARAVWRAGQAQRQSNDQLGTGLRFLGMLLGPVWFGNAGAEGLVLGLLLLVSLPIQALCLSAPAGSSAPLVVKPVKTDRHWRVRELAAVLIYGSYCLLAASTVYLLQGQFGLSQGMALGGMVISTVYGSAVAGAVYLGGQRYQPPPWVMYLPALFLPALVALLLVWPALPLAGWLIGAVLLGGLFALYLLAWRQQVSQQALARQQPGLLARFNNLPNWGALCGFAVLLLVSPLAHRLGLTLATLAGLSLLCGLALLLAAWLRWPGRRCYNNPSHAE